MAHANTQREVRLGGALGGNIYNEYRTHHATTHVLRVDDILDKTWVGLDGMGMS